MLLPPVKLDFSWPIKVSVAIIVIFVVFVAVDSLLLSIMSRRNMIIPSFIALLFLLVPLFAALNSLEGFYTESAIAPYKSQLDIQHSSFRTNVSIGDIFYSENL